MIGTASFRESFVSSPHHSPSVKGSAPIRLSENEKVAREPLDLPASRAASRSPRKKGNHEVLLVGLQDEFERLHVMINDLQMENWNLRREVAEKDVSSEGQCNMVPGNYEVPRTPSAIVGETSEDDLCTDAVLTADGVVEEHKFYPSECSAMNKRPSLQRFDQMPKMGQLALNGKTMSMAFATGEDGEVALSRMERNAKLHAWFDRLIIEGDGLDAYQLQQILKDMRSPSMTIEEIEKVISCLHKNHIDNEQDKCVDSISTPIEGGHYLDNEGEGDDDHILYFPTFADLILWEGMDSLPPHVLQDTIVIRDALMKCHIHELVAHYARLPVISECSILKKMNREKGARIMQILDPVTVFVILVNGLTIGISSDIQWKGWNTLEVVFAAFFATEIIVKLSINGCWIYFFGADRNWNRFDVVVVSLALVDIVLTQIVSSASTNFKDLTLVRMARLARLTRLMRLLRVLRMSIFKELLLMVKGVIAGLRTLFWAIVMLWSIVYACGVLLRQTVGEDDYIIDKTYNTVLFGSIPWSMFNTFRCVMSDCSLPDGTPITGHLYELYGYKFVIPYSVVFMVIFFGIFNMVTAVFVENVLDTAKKKEDLSKEAEQKRIGHLLSNLILKLASKPLDGYSDGSFHRISTLSDGSHSDHKPTRDSSLRSRLISKVMGDKIQTEKDKIMMLSIQGHVTRSDFQLALQDSGTVRLIDELEVKINDRSELFDVLDSDGSGSIDVGELISGIMKMRSGETKQDVVALIIGVRGLRDTLRRVSNTVAETSDKLHEVQGSLRATSSG